MSRYAKYYTDGTSVFVPPPTNRCLTASRAAFNTSTKYVVSKEKYPIVQLDLRKLRDLVAQPLMHKSDKVSLDNSEKQILNNYNLNTSQIIQKGTRIL